MNQAALSAAVWKMERRTDMYISTLQDFVRAMGGQLVITVVFPEGEVQIGQFREAGKKSSRKKMASV